MLTYVGSDDILGTLDLIDFEQYVESGHIVELFSRSLMLALPDFELNEPLSMVLLLNVVVEDLKNLLYITDNVIIGLYVLVDFVFVYINMDNISLVAELLGVACYAVGESGAAGDDEVALLSRHTRSVGAVHTNVAHIESVARGNTSESHKRTAYGRVDFLGELDELVGSVCADYTAAREDERIFSLIDKLNSLCDVSGIGNLVADILGGSERAEVCHLSRDVLGDVDEHGAFSAVCSESEGCADRGSEVFDPLDEVAALCDRLDDVYYVYLLEAVASEEIDVNVTRDNYHGDTVYICRGDTRYGIGSARTRGGHTNSDLARGSGVTVRRVSRSLFVSGEDMIDFVAVLIQSVVGVQSRASGITENGVNALFDQTLADDLRACKLHNISPFLNLIL